ncbi:MAG: ABATE domain-containing protein [Actinomycetota bacterium]|nr:ABATE domain-containing protein [Actinomycetota bacterium]
MDPLPLEPGDYDGTYKLVGGRLSLDLVNTVSWPLEQRRHDWLDRPANLTAWMDAVGLPAVDATADDVEAARILRGVVADVLRPLAHGEVPAPAAVDTFNRRLVAAQARHLVDPATLRWTWAPAECAVEALAPVVVDAAELITSGHQRLKHCPSCDWLFEDATRNGRRRWCDMADCGSRAKSRAHYHRRTS